MLFAQVFALLATGASLGMAAPANVTIVPRNCGTSITQEQLVAAEAHFAVHKVEPKAKAAAATINIYYHVINKGTGESLQARVLDVDYSHHFMI